MKRFLKLLASNVSTWVFLRKILTVNFYRQKKIISENFTCSADDTVLDVGCGTGEFSLCFPEYAYLGIDINPQNIKYASKSYPRKFLIADGMRMPFQNEAFAKILIVGVLHHLADEDCEKMLAEIIRVLKPGGKFLIMEDTKSDFMPIKLVQYFDQGAYIRSFDAWKTLLEKHFPKIENKWVFRHGLCFCSAFLFSKTDG